MPPQATHRVDFFHLGPSRAISGDLGIVAGRCPEVIPRSPEMARDEIGMTLRSPEVILGCGPVSGASGDVDFISGHLGPSRATSESPRGDAPR